MQNIQIPDEQFQKLTVVVQAAGYNDVHAFLNALAEESTEDPRGSLTEEQLRESVAQLERADASIDAGEGIEAEAAFRAISEKHGLKTNL